MAVTRLDKACRTAIQDCMKVKKRERVLTVCDSNKREIGIALHQTALSLGHESFYIEMKPLEVNGQEPADEIAELMKKFDVVFCPTTTSLTHTDAKRNACKEGVRIATFPNITKDIMIRGLSADYNKIAKLSNKLKRIFEKGKEIHVTAPNGTDISFNIEGRTSISSKGLYHKKGEGGNLPTGETFMAPIEGSANGVFVVDGSMAGIGLIKSTPITIEVKDGYATKITGNAQAKKLKQMLDKFGKQAYNIAEFGVGTNDTAKLSGLILEDEKVMGTVHFALGNNISMGGSVNVGIHLDGVIKKPSFWLDGKQMMKDGKLLVT